MLNRYARVLVCFRLFAHDVSAFVQQSGPRPSSNAGVIAMYKGSPAAPTIIRAIPSQDTNFDISEAAHESTAVAPPRPAQHPVVPIATRSREPFVVLLLDGKRLLLPLTPTQLVQSPPATASRRTQVTVSSSIRSGRFP